MTPLLGRLAFLPSVAVAIAVGLALAAPPGGSAQESANVLFIESAAFRSGETTSTALVLRTDDATNILQFSLVVSYDDAIVRPTAVRIDPAWISEGESQLKPGEAVTLDGSSAVGCGPGNSCRLAEIDWVAMAQGSGLLRVTDSNFSDGTGVVTVTVTEAEVNVAEPGGDQAASGDGLGASSGLKVLVWMVLGGFGLAGPITWLVFRLKASSRPGTAGQPVSPSLQSERPLAEELSSAVLNYLSAYEAGAHVSAETDAIYDQMAKQASRTPPAGTADRLAVDS